MMKSLISIGSITMFSRILGFLRDTIIARIFGSGIMADAFLVAFKLPNLLRRIFSEGVFHQVFLPVLSECRYSESQEKLKIFVARILGLLVTILIIIIFIGLFMAPWIITVFAPGFDDSNGKLTVTVKIFRVMLPYVLFISLTSLMSVILNTWNIFMVPAFTPIVLNLSMIGFMLFSEYTCFCSPVMGLAWSVTIGGLLQCIYCLPFLKRINMLVIPKIKFYDKKVCRVFRSMGPTLIIVSSSQISLIINTILASFLRDGSISWMYYADRLIELPIGVFGVTLTTILLPNLSRYIVNKNNKEYLCLMNWSIKLCYIVSFPSVVILGVFSKPLIIALFQYGKFSEFDVLMTQYSVIAYLIGLPGLILIKILTSGLYACNDIKTPLHTVMITIVFTQLINLICINFFKHVTFSISISLGAWVHSGLLYWQFKRKYFFKLQCGWSSFIYRLIASSIILYVICTGLLMLVSDWSQGDIFYRLVKMMGVLIVSGASYCIILWCLGIRLKDFIFFYNK